MCEQVSGLHVSSVERLWRVLCTMCQSPTTAPHCITVAVKGLMFNSQVFVYQNYR